jgi:adenylate kinase family enzyme
MHRIHLIGGSGAGKTTLGRQWAAQLGLPFTDLDDLYREPGWHQVGHAELAQDGWVVAAFQSRWPERSA